MVVATVAADAVVVTVFFCEHSQESARDIRLIAFISPTLGDFRHWSYFKYGYSIDFTLTSSKMSPNFRVLLFQ